MDLTGANLTDSYLMGADLRGAELTDADLRDAKLTHAKLAGAELGGVKLEGADLSYVDLTELDLKRVSLRGATLVNATLTYRQIFDAVELTDEQVESLRGSVGIEKGDILSSRTNSQTYKVVSVAYKNGQLVANIVNTKTRRRYTKKIYRGRTMSDYGVLFYVTNRAKDVFSN